VPYMYGRIYTHSQRNKGIIWNAEEIREVTTRSGAQIRLRPGYQMGGPPTDSKFEFDTECEEHLNAVLGEFEGVHNFHNFTPAALAEQMSAQRRVLCFRLHSHDSCSIMSLDSCSIIGCFWIVFIAAPGIEFTGFPFAAG
jgi:tRNA U38,U39,U40 pseudouridine synthase TruA